MSAALWAALISTAHAEVIREFDSKIVVDEDSSFIVTETIIYDFESESRHGIYRNIDNKHPQEASAWYKTRYIDLSLLSITRDGQPEPYTLESYDGLSIKIGDPNRNISGLHTYEIKYKVKGGLAKYADGIVEVYWNVTGDGWPVTIQHVTTEISTFYSAGLRDNSACYVGFEGSNSTCERKENQGEVVTFSHKILTPGQQLTVARELNFPYVVIVLEQFAFFKYLPIFAAVLWFVFLGWWLYGWKFANRKALSVMAQYEPYGNFNPMFTGVLFDGKLDARDVTAGIVNLAQNGYLRIKQTSEKVLFFDVNDYEVTLLKPLPQSEMTFDDEILDLLFRYTGAGGRSVKLSELKKDRSKLSVNYRIMQDLKKAVEKQMVKDGFLEQRLSRGVNAAIVAGSFYGALHLFFNGFLASGSVLFLGTLVVFLSMGLFALFGLERRTVVGYDALHHLRGFKNYLSTTEKERYKFHNAPARNSQQFMEYLPYAIALGVEKEWAEVFKDINVDAPDWYQSSVPGGHFNAVVFMGDISSFSHVMGSMSGSSRSNSGSGGGGFSGGGGGGGGGGSW